jgi:hypothetical protein
VHRTPIFGSMPLHFPSVFVMETGVFVSRKIEITNNSSRFASVMEIFYTLL